MPELDDDIRATTASIAADADRLARIEAEKARLDPDDPRLKDLSDEAVDVSEELLGKAHAEEELVEESQRKQTR
jgi:hypothetical protein